MLIPNIQSLEIKITKTVKSTKFGVEKWQSTNLKSKVLLLVLAQMLLFFQMAGENFNLKQGLGDFWKTRMELLFSMYQGNHVMIPPYSRRW
mgnify:CR=1 FL=1